MREGMAQRLEGRLARGRAAAESRMTSRVTIRRLTGRMVQNETTGLEVPEWATVATSVPFRLDGGTSGDGGSRTESVAGVEFETATALGHLPVATTDLADGDLIEITSGEWPGTVWRVVKAVVGDQKTARRVPIEGVRRPEEWP